MKVDIQITRRVEYANLVEMPLEQYQKLKSELDGNDKALRKLAEQAINKMLDERDWQDDELASIEEFSEYKEP